MGSVDVAALASAFVLAVAEGDPSAPTRADELASAVRSAVEREAGFYLELAAAVLGEARDGDADESGGDYDTQLAELRDEVAELRARIDGDEDEEDEDDDED